MEMYALLSRPSLRPTPERHAPPTGGLGGWFHSPVRLQAAAAGTGGGDGTGPGLGAEDGVGNADWHRGGAGLDTHRLLLPPELPLEPLQSGSSSQSRVSLSLLG